VGTEDWPSSVTFPPPTTITLVVEVNGSGTTVRALAAAISADPRDYYVNVHNAKFPRVPSVAS
jgi:hypothetical protein